MANKRAAFAVLQDFSTSVGLALHKVLQGDAQASKNALAALSFKDGAGNLRYPKVDAQDRVLVSSNAGDEACLSARGELVGGSLVSADVTGATITLVADLSYEEIGVVVSCTRDTLFQLVQLDDVTETILADIMLEAGESTFGIQLHCLAFTAGSTGTQTLRIVGINLDTASDMRATLTVSEIQP